MTHVFVSVRQSFCKQAGSAATEPFCLVTKLNNSVPHAQHFYHNQLQDAPSIVGAPDEPFYALQLLKPYVFFDVSRGQMARGRSGASMGNQVRSLRRVWIRVSLSGAVTKGRASHGVCRKTESAFDATIEHFTWLRPKQSIQVPVAMV